MRIGHGQLESITGDIEANLAKVIRTLEQADHNEVEIVCFPECFLTGYPTDEKTVRASAFSLDSPQMMRVIDATSKFEAVHMLGFNEVRGADLYNTIAVLHKGHLLGTYSKCFAYQPFHKQGRDFPVFEHHGITFGVIICADGGYIEPARILALKGAQIIFAPHFNFIPAKSLVYHFQKVRSDHIARAVENQIYFLRGNNVVLHPSPELGPADGQGYGDSYVLDPNGEMIARSPRDQEHLLMTDIEPERFSDPWGKGRSLQSIQALQEHLLAAMKSNLEAARKK
jgi:5-aminopentanamidase